MKKIAILVSIPFFINTHLENKINHLLKKKFHITLITKSDISLENFKKNINLEVININFSRKVSIVNDFFILFSLIFHFVFNRYDIIHSYTPKVGLLTSLASKITFHKIVIHTFTGQHWKNYRGIKKIFFKMIDKIIINFNFSCFADSYSQIDFLINEQICKKNDIQIINYGSVGGINFDKFNHSLLNKNKILESLELKFLNHFLNMKLLNQI
ncbi:hypothetical protein OAQ39_05230 [Alphaproteobacteria bacterium]|nr:hypothetical protein [Alphaproteobacteria bacterium]